MDTTTWVATLGNLAAVVIAFSITRRSILSLRRFSLLGGLMFAIYGALISAWPIVVLNLFTAGINIVHIVRAYRTQESFRLVEIIRHSSYLLDFLSFHRQDIERFFPNFDASRLGEMTGFYVLRDSHTAGLFLGYALDDGGFMVELDFATPKFRDYKIADYILRDQSWFFSTKKCNHLVQRTQVKEHMKYLLNVGYLRQTADNAPIQVFHKRLLTTSRQKSTDPTALREPEV